MEKEKAMEEVKKTAISRERGLETTMKESTTMVCSLALSMQSIVAAVDAAEEALGCWPNPWPKGWRCHQWPSASCATSGYFQPRTSDQDALRHGA